MVSSALGASKVSATCTVQNPPDPFRSAELQPGSLQEQPELVVLEDAVLLAQDNRLHEVNYWHSDIEFGCWYVC